MKRIVMPAVLAACLSMSCKVQLTPEVEQKYKQSNPNLDFSHVDAIEKTSVDPAELEAFAKEGQLP